MTETEIEKRLSAMEHEIARLKAERPAAIAPHPVHALDAIHATFENDAAFHEAARLGRQWRKSQGLKARKMSEKRK